jgi:succinyl-diaminopimelate desuccinylase
VTSPSVATSVVDVDADDLLALTTALVAVRSESHHEAELADLVESRLRARASSLTIDRIGTNVIARTMLDRERRVVLGGHLDTVPANAGNEVPSVDGDGDVLHGLGSADMKGGLAVLLRLAEVLHRDPSPARHDVTLAFYECEEVRDEFNGLGKVFAARPDVLAADFAVLLEPTDGWVEAGCQGVLVARAGFDGERAHAARPWMGRNAIHRASVVLARLAAHETDVVDVGGLEFREAFQVVGIEGGIPDKHNVVLHHHREPPVRAQVLARGGGSTGAGAARGRRRRRDHPGAGRGPAEPHRPPGRRLRAPPLAAGATQARVDRRRPLRVPRDPRAQFRARRPDHRAHPGRAGDPGVARAGVRHARRVRRGGVGRRDLG